MPEADSFLCGDWVWDPSLRELRHYERKKKGWADEPDGAERLPTVSSVTWHRWSQAPMQTSTGRPMSTSQSRVVAAYEGGGNLTVDEPDRGCAEKLATAMASAFGLEVVQEGAPGGRRAGNLPSRDQMGRLVNKDGRQEVILDEVAREITVVKSKRPFGKSRRSLPTSEIRYLELEYTVRGPTERFAVVAALGPEEERLALAAFEGYEGWADPQEWREFTQELGRSLGVESRIDAPSG
jgi:hypothetical protein